MSDHKPAVGSMIAGDLVRDNRLLHEEIGRLQAKLNAIRLETIEECRLAVGVYIKSGPLQGNGCDDTAQRNGMILAQNILYGLANAPVVERHGIEPDER